MAELGRQAECGSDLAVQLERLAARGLHAVRAGRSEHDARRAVDDHASLARAVDDRRYDVLGLAALLAHAGHEERQFIADRPTDLAGFLGIGGAYDDPAVPVLVPDGGHLLGDMEVKRVTTLDNQALELHGAWVRGEPHDDDALRPREEGLERLTAEIAVDGHGVEGQVIEVGLDVAVVRVADVAALDVEDQWCCRCHSVNELDRLGQSVHAGAAVPLVEGGIRLVDGSDVMGRLNDAAVEVEHLLRGKGRVGLDCFGELRIRGVGVEPDTDVTSLAPHRMHHPHEMAVWHGLSFLPYVRIVA